MKCPYCNYVTDEYDFEEDKYIEGEHGSFFTLSNGIMMSRHNRGCFGDAETTELYGCPSCGNTFIKP